MSEVSERARVLVAGEHGAGVDDATPVALQAPGIEPVARSIGRMLTALGELMGTSATTAEVRVGNLELAYERLPRPNGAIRARFLDEPEPPAEGLRVVPVGPEVAGGSAGTDPSEIGQWERGVSAARAGAHSEALAHFGWEADRAASRGSHARAAIAYRSASIEADRVGRSDLANRLLRLAGKHYLCAAEGRETPLRGVRQAYEAAAKCFLHAGNLELAETSIRRARSLDDSLG